MRKKLLFPPCAVVAALLLVSGCGGGLSYKLTPREGASWYDVEIESGRIEKTPEGEEVKIPAPVNRNYLVRFEPTQRRGGKTWLKLQTEAAHSGGSGSESNLGSETLVMDRYGNFEERLGIPPPFETELFLPLLPGKIKKGESWTVKRPKRVGNTNLPREWKFKYLGRGAGGMRHCRMISLAIRHDEESDQDMPRGPKIHFKVDYEFGGDICFSGGRVKQADYFETIALTLSTAGPENIAMQKRDYSRYKIRWTKKPPGKDSSR